MIKVAGDPQPISARFGNADWLTNWVQPNNPDVLMLLKKLKGRDVQETAFNAWQWVSHQIKYKSSLRGTINVEGQSIVQNDLWLYPGEQIQILRGNCACKSFLLASLLKSQIPNTQVVLGNLKHESIGGHAWVQINFDGTDYILEGTQPNMNNPFISVNMVDMYEPVVFFDNEKTEYVYGRTLQEPLGLCGIKWLEDYLCERCLKEL